MTLLPLQIAHQAFAKAAGVQMECLSPQQTYFSCAFRYPVANANLPPLDYEICLEWSAKQRLLTFNLGLESMTFKPWSEDAMYAFFNELTKCVRPFLPLTSRVQQACYVTPIFKDSAMRVLIPALMAQFHCDKTEEDELGNAVELLMKHASRAMYITEPVFTPLRVGRLLTKQEQLRELCVAWESLKLHLERSEGEEEDEEPTKETHPWMFH